MADSLGESRERRRFESSLAIAPSAAAQLWMEMPNGTSIDFPREAETVFDIMFRRDGIISVATSLGEFHFDAATGRAKK